LNSAEIYDPKTNSFAETGNLVEARTRMAGAALLLDGRALIVGGAASAEIFDAVKGEFRTVDGSLDTARFSGAAVQLMDGSLRIFGGFDSSGASTAKSWIYRPY
jgi:hypothetical protein